LAIQCGFQNDNAIIITVKFAKLRGRLGLRLHQHSPPATLLDVPVQWILGDSIKRANLNEREFSTELKHTSTDDVVKLQTTEESRLKELPWTIPRPLNLVAKCGQPNLNQLSHDPTDWFKPPDAPPLHSRVPIHFR
jgi:hypothetical protein